MSPTPDRPGARRWTLHAPTGPVDVEVAAPDSSSVGELRAALAGVLGRGADVWVGSDRLTDRVRLTDERLRHGAQLGLGQPGPRTGGSSGALELHVTGGPDAGGTFPLAQGRLVIGRGRGAGRCRVRIVLADPDVSREHVAVTVSGTGVAVHDLGSSNGTELVGPLADHPVGSEPVPWPLGAALRVGSSTVRLTAPTGRPLPVHGATAGRWTARPADRQPAPAVAAVQVPLPRAPSDTPSRAPAWVAIALPAVGGGLLAWLLGAPQFLFFALLSPVVAVGSWLSDRWSGRRGRRRRVAEHAAELAEAEAAVLAAVAHEVVQRDAAAPDLARLAAAVRRRAAPLWERGVADPELLVVRLGVGPGSTSVSAEPADGPAVVESAPRLPVTIDLRRAGLAVHGPRGSALGVARSVVCQVVALHPPDAVHVALVSSAAAADDWRWLRWVPHLSPTSERGDAVQLLVVDGPLDDAARERLRSARHAAGAVLTIGCAEPGPAGSAVLQIGGETGERALLCRAGMPDQPVLLDLAGAEVAGRLATDLAPLDTPTAASGIPDQVRWADLVGASAGWSRSRSTLRARLGVSDAGPVELDLCAAGPHALVAGTTGAGKSELLRTLVLGLATAHPPDRCSFLLVDYKGGAAFGEASALPHTVGVLTDLDGASTARALQSLGAELTRRERVLAAHGARDLAALADDVLLPRLVIVVDEFATLGDELPGFVPGLVAIAQRGRSLGVHLVLATQRPSGSVSPEIRANCTVRLCLRTTDEAGSRDVLGTPDAAWLPVDRPGRALLRVGSAPPVAFQVARVGVPALAPGPRITVRRWAWPDPAPPPAAAEAATDLARTVAELRRRADDEGRPPPPRPWLPPLPDRVEATGWPTTVDRVPTVLRWGLVDRPGDQDQVPLLLDLAAGGGWLVVGGPGSGRTTVLRTVLAEAVHQLPPAGLHVHVVDHGGGTLAAAARGLPHAGTALGRSDTHRLHRLVTRLQEEVDARRAVAVPGPPLLLLVDGVDDVTGALDELEPGSGGNALLRLVRDGAAVGLTCVLTSDRLVPGGRWAAAAGHRLVLPFAERADYAVAGIPARSVPGHRPPGRALYGEDAVEVQVALPRDLPDVPAHPGRVTGRIEVVELPPDPVAGHGAGRRPGTVVVGPGGDEGRPVSVDLLRSGGLLVVGPPGSGRSSTLAALAGRLVAAGTPALVTGPRQQPPAEAGVARADPTDVAALRSWAERLAGGPGVVLADDLGALPDAALDVLAEITTAGGPAVLVGAATAADVAGAFRGPAPALRRTRSALVLQAARGDAELLSLRLPRAPLPARPGAGWLVLAGAVTRIQVARK